jgi:hypothetical protein
MTIPVKHAIERTGCTANRGKGDGERGTRVDVIGKAVVPGRPQVLKVLQRFD